MKKHILSILFMLTMITSLTGQNKQYITLKDFVPNINNQIKCDKIIKTLSGENEEVNTKVFIGKQKDSKTDVKLLNTMIDDILLRSRLNLKNKSSFKAIDIKIYQKEDLNWMTYITYSGTNDLGARKDSEFSITYDQQMNITKTFSPY